jgi:ketosteroid isomerase-like protein
MRKIFLCFCLSGVLLSCTDDKKETPAAKEDDGGISVALPYTASYSSSWSTAVSDADLKSVLMTYKDWADGNMTGLSDGMADSVEVDMSSGYHFKKSNADLMKMWSTYRDSLSSVYIDMEAWQKMYSTDKNEGHVVTWYKEIDTYKDGRVDSAYYHDINRVKDGKITWYAQYKRPAK